MFEQFGAYTKLKMLQLDVEHIFCYYRSPKSKEYSFYYFKDLSCDFNFYELLVIEKQDENFIITWGEMEKPKMRAFTYRKLLHITAFSE